MADTQLDLFNRKKYTGILPRTTEILPPTSDSSALQSLPAYHTYLSSGGHSKYTPDDFTSDVRKFGLFVKDKKIGEVRTADIQQWIAELTKVLSAKTVSRKVAALSNYFLWLVSIEVFDHKTNPAGAIRYARVTSPLPDILFENECQALLKASSSDPRTYFLVLLLLAHLLKTGRRST
jgi:site-specific recombinase XerD